MSLCGEDGLFASVPKSRAGILLNPVDGFKDVAQKISQLKGILLSAHIG